MKVLALFLCMLCLQGCIYVTPTPAKHQPAPCATVTKKMTLEPHAMENYSTCREGSACLAAFASGLVGSVIVAGSLVLANNTLHWAEYEASCKDLQALPPKPHGCVQECDLATQKCVCLN